MRRVSLGLIGLVALVGVAASASATPLVPNPGSSQSANIVQVWGGCGWGLHSNRWGHCVRNRRGYHRPSWHYGYYGGGYHWPYWRNSYWYGYRVGRN